MFSTETPPCPSSAVRSPDHLVSEVATADRVARSPSFSIRDYVFSSRSKDIATNWPFPQEFLQFCVKHGVRDLLPPFEPPVSLRTCCSKVIESEQSVDRLEAPVNSAQLESLDTRDICLLDEEPCNIKEPCLRSDDLVLGCSKQGLCPLLEKHEQVDDCGNISDDETSKDNAEPVSVVKNQDIRERISNHTSVVLCSQEARSGSVLSTEVEIAQLDSSPEPKNLRQPSQKKCRLIVKLSVIAETKLTEGIDSTSSTVSDPMASKVCPVCKLFASSSNTTLNAHIDQCLSAESNTQQAVVETAKSKVKATKKRLMVDIYATAPHSTLEDLDRRNGTNWTSELSCNPPITEVPTENKRPKISPLDAREDELATDARNDENEEAVYVDSNGIKLRILSKFNDTPPVIPAEPFKSEEHTENIIAGKSLLLKKKTRFTSKYSKSVKVKPQTRRFSSFELFKGKIQAVPEGDKNATPLQEGECSPAEMSNAPQQIRNSSSAAIRRWICSKSSDLPKMFDNKEVHSLEKSVYRKRSQSPESNQPDVRNSSVVQSHDLKFSRTEENLTSSVKTRSVDLLSNTSERKDNETCPKPPFFNSKWPSESNSRRGLMLKISRSVREPISSSRSRREEIDKLGNTDISCAMTSKPSKTGHSSLKAKRSSTMKKNAVFSKPSFLLDASKSGDGDQLSANMKFRKQRSVLRTGKQGQSPSDVARTSQGLQTRRSGLLELASRPATQVITNQETPSCSNISESDEGEYVSMMEKQKRFSLKWLHPDAECSDLDMATSNAHIDSSTHVATVGEPSTETASDDPTISDVIPTDCALPSIAKIDLKPPADEHLQPLHGIDVERPEKSPYEQEQQNCNPTSDKVVSESMKVAYETMSGYNLDSCADQYTECQAKTASVQISSACLTNHSGSMHETPQGNLSITYVKKASDQCPSSAIEPSGSPISTASTICESPKDSELKNSKGETLARSTIRVEIESTMPCSRRVEDTEGTNIGRRNVEVGAFPSPKGPDQFLGDELCSCSQREGLSKESQFMRENIISGMMFHSKGNQSSNLYISPGIPSSFNPYTRLRTDLYLVPVLDSPSSSISSKALESAVKAPNSVDVSSPSPSPRARTNSVLRLMGKDLMVASNDAPAELPMAPHSSPDNADGQMSLPTIFGDTGLDSFSYHNHRFPGGAAVFGLDPSIVHQQLPLHSPTIQVGRYVGPVRAGLKMEPDQQTRYNWNKMANSPPFCHVGRMAASHPCHQKPITPSREKMLKEVIVLDDSSEVESGSNYVVVSSVDVLPIIPGSDTTHPRSKSCFESQSQFFSRDVTSCFRPCPIACQRYYTNNTMHRTLEAPDRSVPGPVVFQSPSTGHLRPPLYYSQMLR